MSFVSLQLENGVETTIRPLVVRPWLAAISRVLAASKEVVAISALMTQAVGGSTTSPIQCTRPASVSAQ
jgi:hypothetical protein